MPGTDIYIIYRGLLCRTYFDVSSDIAGRLTQPWWGFVLFCFLIVFIYFWLCWIFVSVRGLSLVAASGGHSSSRCAGLSLLRPLLLRSTGSRRTGSVVVAHGLSRSVACGILPDQSLNPCPLHWQADSQPLHHQGSPLMRFWLKKTSIKLRDTDKIWWLQITL